MAPPPCSCYWPFRVHSGLTTVDKVRRETTFLLDQCWDWCPWRYSEVSLIQGVLSLLSYHQTWPTTLCSHSRILPEEISRGLHDAGWLKRTGILEAKLLFGWPWLAYPTGYGTFHPWFRIPQVVILRQRTHLKPGDLVSKSSQRSVLCVPFVHFLFPRTQVFRLLLPQPVLSLLVSLLLLTVIQGRCWCPLPCGPKQELRENVFVLLSGWVSHTWR